MDTVDISGLDKAALLAELYNHAPQVGLGLADPRGQLRMTVDQAREILAQQQDFDYLYGRVIKVNLESDQVRTGLYNRDNGADAFENIVAKLRGQR